MFLKIESFEHSGMIVTPSELSVLQRIEHLAWLREQEKKVESSGNLQVSVEGPIRGGAFLVAISLWYNHPQKTKLSPMNEVIKQIEREALTTWPTEAIAQVENVVSRLSGMSEFVVNNAPKQTDDAGSAEPASAGKCPTMS